MRRCVLAWAPLRRLLPQRAESPPFLITNFLLPGRFAVDGREEDASVLWVSVGHSVGEGCIEPGVCVVFFNLVSVFLGGGYWRDRMGGDDVLPFFPSLFLFLLKKQGDDGVSVGWWLPGSRCWVGVGGALVQEKFWLVFLFSFSFLRRAVVASSISPSS